ncbi:hypothetical protein, variant 2 [Aphanomyces astaci]|uniref:Uncharacterized protein n=2 Tax=Aphanomyces astaci TaxID=112090 RepID=W4GXL0_APHAT|nr:hypothetical protein, variant 2 [Aphanomyces astaci]ETV83638.1 hypothetical protein, variant 2 [Aphanomyces astaci]|eukprot:XP_009827067.1 hypothetical protein, variant 2 [Aphanomyces astaci]
MRVENVKPRPPPLSKQAPLRSSRRVMGGSHDAKSSVAAVPADELTRIKALFSEIVRLGIARSQDTAQLCSNNGRPSLSTHSTTRLGMECQYREEWRVSREDNIFKQLDHFLSQSSIQLQDHNDLHDHLRLAMETIASTIGSNELKPQRSTSKQQQQLLRAMHLDQALRRMEGRDKTSPLLICQDMVRGTRAQFQQVLAGDTSSTLTSLPPSSHITTPDNQVLDRSSSEVQLRKLYENVAAIKSVELVNAPTSTGFTRLLEAQRWAEVSKSNEERAHAHRKHVLVRRIQRTFRFYRAVAKEGERVALARSQLEFHAASRLQRQYRRWKQWMTFKSNRLVTFRRNFSAIRIAAWVVFRFRFQKCCRRFHADSWLPPAVSLLLEESATCEPPDEWKVLTSAVIKIQSTVRRHLVRRRVRQTWHFHLLRRRRQDRLEWRDARNLHQSTAILVDELVEWHRMLSLEQERTQAAIVAEHKVFIVEWEKYSADLTKQCLKAKLTDEWVPQLDSHSGNTYYLNLKSTAIHHDHPNRQLAAKLVTKQRRRAEAQFQERIRRLEAHLAQVTMAKSSHDSAIEREMCALWGCGGALS